ncbi:hypothetical protein CDD80_2900 [Ophiocordyceps camponoti-rufipedis]|uniref:Large ribosomal subunit protein mL38 n=1 Tax=Ophiocordyceps camponoti-rufipedis TaxID=2004952 RepID=A0A2C5Z4P7_9HYPO|nr:hypothetical protein CDD80_2900 [Ophiocordyceps camponoti-rufipedis]
MSRLRHVVRPLAGLPLRLRPDVIVSRRLESSVAGPPPPPYQPPEVPPPPPTPAAPSSASPPPPPGSSGSASPPPSGSAGSPPPSPSASSSAAGNPKPAPTAADLDPNTVPPRFEKDLMKQGLMPIGSRRRRAAIRTPGNDIPFEQLPYQTFQEALKIIAADRLEKIERIRIEAAKIARLEQKDPETINGGQRAKDQRLKDMRKEIEDLKILADINDPLVKKRFEDGLGDMNKPIYRYYTRQKWLGYDHKLIVQRIEQFHIVPDLVDKLEPTIDVKLFFGGKKISPGSIIPSNVSETIPLLRVQLFERGERLFTVVVVDADVPDVSKDGFWKRCHFLAANIPLDPCNTSLPLSKLNTDKIALPWLPPTSQKGAPYHRLAILLLEQVDNETVDVAKMREAYSSRDHFCVRVLRERFKLRPTGFNMFRSVWDDTMAEVMQRHNIPGSDVELRRVHIPSMKPYRGPRGWEAKRQGPKYRHLWHRTRRIKGLSSGRGWTKRR